MRVSRFAIGSFAHKPYDSSNAEHVEREANAYIALDGNKYVRDYFHLILPKVNEQIFFSFNGCSRLNVNFMIIFEEYTSVRNYRV